jgi:hypothetical protein
VESIEMKLRWLARRLRRTDDYGVIEQWITSVTSLNHLRQTFKVSSTTCPLQNNECWVKPFAERDYLIISAPNKISWESNEDDMTARSDTPFPLDLPDLKHLTPGKLYSSSEGHRLSPCVEFDEPPRKKGITRRTGVEGNILLPAKDMIDPDMDIDIRTGQDAPAVVEDAPAVVEDDRKPIIPKDRPLTVWNCLRTKLEAGGKSYDFYDEPTFNKLISDVAEELGLRKDVLLRKDSMNVLSKLKYNFFFSPYG